MCKLKEEKSLHLLEKKKHSIELARLKQSIQEKNHMLTLIKK